MQNIPMFTTQNGVASLSLREIPYQQTAYITIRDSQHPQDLLQECVDFCKMAGADQIYATGHEILQAYPLYTALLQFRRPKEGLQQSHGELHPVTSETADMWRNLHNERMRNVPNSATMTCNDVAKHIQNGTGYLVYKDTELLGIGVAGGDTVDSVIAVKPRAGEDVLLALCSALTSDTVNLQVASVNQKAIRLYRRLGFAECGEIRRWYCVANK